MLLLSILQLFPTCVLGFFLLSLYCKKTVEVIPVGQDLVRLCSVPFKNERRSCNYETKNAYITHNIFCYHADWAYLVHCPNQRGKQRRIHLPGHPYTCFVFQIQKDRRKPIVHERRLPLHRGAFGVWGENRGHGFLADSLSAMNASMERIAAQSPAITVRI